MDMERADGRRAWLKRKIETLTCAPNLRPQEYMPCAVPRTCGVRTAVGTALGSDFLRLRRSITQKVSSRIAASIGFGSQFRNRSEGATDHREVPDADA
jgi:hypothetical protein